MATVWVRSWVIHYIYMIYMMCVCVCPLTVGASVHLHPEAHPPAGVPVQGYEAQESCPDGVGQPVLDHSLRVHVPDELLWEQDGTAGVLVTGAQQQSDGIVSGVELKLHGALLPKHKCFFSLSGDGTFGRN